MNAAAEFQCIWKESMNGQKPRAVITDEIGKILMKLQTQLEESNLFENLPGRRAVLKQAVPKTLITKVGLDTLMTRLPESYQRSLFSRFAPLALVFPLHLTDRISPLTAVSLHDLVLSLSSISSSMAYRPPLLISSVSIFASYPDPKKLVCYVPLNELFLS
jgi:hypothetical protein